MLLARGADVTIGDSPGGPHSLPLLNRVYAATGMDRVEKLGAKLNRNMNEKTVDFPEGKVLKISHTQSIWMRLMQLLISVN